MNHRSFNNRKKICVVEDEPLVREVLKRYLNQLGYRVCDSASVEKALVKIREESPEAIITDYNLPDQTGLELIRSVREFDDQIPVILISAYEISEEDMQQFRQLGGRGLLRKPFGFQHLRFAMRMIFKEKRFGFKKSRFFLKDPGYDLSPRYLAREIFKKVFREGIDPGDHVHFHVSDHPDHIILLCSRNNMGKVIAKATECRKGEYIQWEKSSFYGYDPARVFKELGEQVSQVRVDSPEYEMSWPTLPDFLCWLELNY